VRLILTREAVVPTTRFFRQHLPVLLLVLLSLAALTAGIALTAPAKADPLPAPSFTTIPHIVLQNPMVVSTSPDDGDTNVYYDPVISATFDRTIDPSTMSSANFYLTKSGGTPVSATLKYSTDKLGWYLYPTYNLEPGVTYQATLTAAVRGENGLALWDAPVTWSFTTVYFTDVSLDNPYAIAISHLAAATIIGGFADHSYRPGEAVKRMQFAKIIALSLNLQPTVNDVCPFSDVPSDLDANDPLYPDHYVAAAFAHGVTQGKTAATFAPYDSITRFQLISMVIRAAQTKLPGLLQTPPTDYQPTWNTALSPDHGENARLAEYNHLLKGIPLANLDPWDPMPRGEVAQVLYNLFNRF
jgi:hypothetical protein